MANPCKERKWGDWKHLEAATTKELQVILKLALKKTEALDFAHRLGYQNYDPNEIIKFRSLCQNMKLRHIYYRLITRDFYTKQRMFRFRMRLDDRCMRCGMIEDYRIVLVLFLVRCYDKK